MISFFSTENMKVDFESQYGQKEGVITREIAGETVLVPVSGQLANLQKIFYLDPVSRFIWGRLDGKKSLADICLEVETNFEVSSEQVHKDTIAFMKDLLKEGLVIGDSQ